MFPSTLPLAALLATTAAVSTSASYIPNQARGDSSGVIHSSSLASLPSSFTVDLYHTPSAKKRAANPNDSILSWLVAERQRTDAKYGIQSARKRSDKRDTVITLQDENVDASYSGKVSVGTPAQTFDLILDTGSSDLWVAGSECTSSACTGVTTFEPSSSSTFTNLTTSFDISYGSGDAVGYAATDVVSLGGETVSTQKIAIVTNTDAGLISAPISGLMGLGFASLSQLSTTPWWQNLASNSWSEKLFAFKMARFRDDPTASSVEAQGGTVNFGSLNSSLYTGDINYITLTEQAYWQIPILGAKVQGNEISVNTTVSSGSSSSLNPFSTSSGSTQGYPQAAIDTGTTLISLPTDVTARIYAQISGSQAVTASGYSGYYQYPCNTNVVVALNFGGVYYDISSADFNIGRLNSASSLCLGGIYGADLGSSSLIQSIVGATFLKNVYSVYKYSGSDSGSQVGFASLSDGSTTTSGNATGSNPTTGTTSSSGTSSSAGFPTLQHGSTITLAVALLGSVASLVALV